MSPSRRLVLRRRRRGRKILLGLLSIVALYFFFNSSYFSLTDIRVDGGQKVKAEEVQTLAGLQLGTNLWRLDLKDVKDRLARHPLIEEVIVRRRWPRGLTIQVKERQPLAVVNAGDTTFLVLDAQGVIIRRMDKVGQMHLPLITGIKVPPESGLGTRITSPHLQAALTTLSAMPSSDRDQVIEINCAYPESLHLFLTGDIEVKFGDSSRVKEKLAQIREILQQTGYEKAIAYINVSFVGPPVIKFKP